MFPAPYESTLLAPAGFGHAYLSYICCMYDLDARLGGLTTTHAVPYIGILVVTYR